MTRDINFGYIAIIIQSFAVFVAISILLGRIYYITYFRTLGVPLTELRPNAVDYAIVSPDVTLAGIGLAIMWALFLWSSGPFKPSRQMGEISSFFGIVLSLFLGSLLTQVIYTPGVATDLALSYPGALGVLSVLGLFFFVYGGTLIGASLRGKNRSDGDGKQGNATFDFRRAFRPAVFAILAIVAVFLIIRSPSTIARIDANNTLMNSPQAKVEFKASHPVFLPPSYEECHSRSPGCSLRVVLVDSRFVYVRLVETDTLGSEEQPVDEKRTIAFPVADVASITYISE